MLVIDKVNKIARIIYAGMGYSVPDGYDFLEAHHPQEVACLDTACAIWEEFFGDTPEWYANWIPPSYSE